MYVTMISMSKTACIIPFMIIGQIHMLYIDALIILLMPFFIVHASHTQYNIHTDVPSLDVVFMPTGRQGGELNPDT